MRQYVEDQGYKGWDPYDGLTSRLFRAIPGFKQSRFLRLAWIQTFKRSPINLRPLTGVKKDYNPKGLGLFITGYCRQYQQTGEAELLDKIHKLCRQVIDLRTPGYSGSCWGYNFDWQARAFFQPAYTPTVVATTFITSALLDAYEITGDQEYLDVSIDATQFVLQDLNRTNDEKGNYALSYSPLDHTQVFNASLLGAKLLSRVHEHAPQPHYLIEAKKIVQYACDHQAPDGSWPYSRLPYQQWIDSFHTGYNLECIHHYRRVSGDTDYDEHMEKGLQYYLDNFWLPDGTPKYFHDKTYPIDIHAPAQMVLTFHALGILDEQKELVDRVLHWTIDNMQDKKGYFYYQIKPGMTSRIPYIRWAQGWMFYALSHYPVQ